MNAICTVYQHYLLLYADTIFALNEPSYGEPLGSWGWYRQHRNDYSETKNQKLDRKTIRKCRKYYREFTDAYEKYLHNPQKTLDDSMLHDVVMLNLLVIKAVLDPITKDLSKYKGDPKTFENLYYATYEIGQSIRRTLLGDKSAWDMSAYMLEGIRSINVVMMATDEGLKWIRAKAYKA
jgi:hypothetical protein